MSHELAIHHPDRWPDRTVEANGFRLLTDPTFDPPGEYRLSHVTGPVDAVLLSHDLHADDFDRSANSRCAPASVVNRFGADMAKSGQN